ncbi:NlpC/P60 family protein [Leucobacter sp. wl10]|uniref:NlpC/P60 family protein n=1 Tax=Leucobacter sp. wl10 TaxID=2304677 RepID=UPI001968EE57|nr:NlpC/P60 family protein [Leucobacter sp. wl10]
MAGAATLSLGLVGTFSIPAYALAPEPEGAPDGVATSQTLQTVSFEETALPLTAPEGEVGAEILAQEQKAAEEKAAAERAAKQQREQAAAAQPPQGGGAAPGQDVPAGAGAQGIVNAALAQLGQYQDCTRLIERALQAIGIPAGDLGTQVAEHTALGGVLVTDGSYAPGDVLVWPGQHTAIYLGNGQAVHSGWGGNQTVIATYASPSATPYVVRFG